MAGLGSGLSFPGLKNYPLKLKDLESARLFAGLSIAIRLGMLFGYRGPADLLSALVEKIC